MFAGEQRKKKLSQRWLFLYIINKNLNMLICSRYMFAQRILQLFEKDINKENPMFVLWKLISDTQKTKKYF